MTEHVSIPHAPTNNKKEKEKGNRKGRVTPRDRDENSLAYESVGLVLQDRMPLRLKYLKNKSYALKQEKPLCKIGSAISLPPDLAYTDVVKKKLCYVKLQVSQKQKWMENVNLIV